MATSGLNVFVLGHTGETGKALVRVLAKDTRYRKVKLIGRRTVELPFEDAKFEQVVVDFEKLSEHEAAFGGCDTGFCCLGTTRGKAGAANFVRVDRDYVVDSGRVARAAGCNHFLVVTATGSNSKSMVLYNKTKGEAEDLLKEIKFPNLTILQPGLLLGPRVESRPMERFFKFICTPFAAAFPTAFSVHVDVLARALANVAASPPADCVHVLDNKAIHKAANAPS